LAETSFTATTSVFRATVHNVGRPVAPHAPAPLAWLTFLHQVLPEDSESQDLLQEWLGYLLTVRTHHQKILMIVGPSIWLMTRRAPEAT
jgi:phage/plasmid-associated DNA primase